MGLISNTAQSLSGKVDKALLCVKKPSAAKVNSAFEDVANKNGLTLTNDQRKNLPLAGGATSNVDLRAKLLASQKGFISSFSAMTNVAGPLGYHVLEVKYNPSRIRIYSHGGNQLMPGPAGAGTNMQVMSTMPATTTMQVELLFDDVNNQDAFMAEKFSNISAGAIVSDIAGGIKTGKGDGYTVQHQIEGMIAMITQSETRQVVFYWGDMAYAGEVISLEAKYTMFNPVGHPIRGTVSLTIQDGGPDEDGSGEEYWADAYKEMTQGNRLRSNLSGALGNIINLK